MIVVDFVGTFVVEGEVDSDRVLEAEVDCDPVTDEDVDDETVWECETVIVDVSLIEVDVDSLVDGVR